MDLQADEGGLGGKDGGRREGDERRSGKRPAYVSDLTRYRVTKVTSTVSDSYEDA